MYGINRSEVKVAYTESWLRDTRTRLQPVRSICRFVPVRIDTNMFYP